MKNYISLFESFEEAFDDFYQRPDTKSDLFYHTVSKELIELANQYLMNPSKIDPHSDKYSTPTRLTDLQNDLTAEIYDNGTEDLANDFAAESDSLLQSYEVSEMKKGKMFNKKSKILDNGMLDGEPSSVKYERPGRKITARSTRTGN